MQKLELLTVLYSLEAMLDKDDVEDARRVIKKVIAAAEGKIPAKKDSTSKN
jgi:hypothetical protein